MSNKELIDKLASFVKIPSPIPAKTLKEVNEITKYFKNNSQSKKKSNNKKLYAQALIFFFTIKEILKIKEIFSNLQAYKIKNI